jgi:hypothetical protein
MFAELNTPDNSSFLIDYALLREMQVTDIELMLRTMEAKLFPLGPPTYCEDRGLVFADCGCIDFVKSYWSDPITRFRELSCTHYHGRTCTMYAYGLPMEHTELKFFKDHLHVPIFIELLEELNRAVAKEVFPVGYNFFENDTLGDIADIARA